MRSNIDRTKRKLEQRDETDTVYVDGDSSEAILRALCDSVTPDFEAYVEEELGLNIDNKQYVGIGSEVEIK